MIHRARSPHLRTVLFDRRRSLPKWRAYVPAELEAGSVIAHCWRVKPHSRPVWLGKKRRKRPASQTKAEARPECRRVGGGEILLSTLLSHSQKGYSRPRLRCGRSSRHSRAAQPCPTWSLRVRWRRLRGHIEHRRANSEL